MGSPSVRLRLGGECGEVELELAPSSWEEPSQVSVFCTKVEAQNIRVLEREGRWRVWRVASVYTITPSPQVTFSACDSCCCWLGALPTKCSDTQHFTILIKGRITWSPKQCSRLESSMIEALIWVWFWRAFKFQPFIWRASSNPRRQSKIIKIKCKIHIKLVHKLYGMCF